MVTACIFSRLTSSGRGLGGKSGIGLAICGMYGCGGCDGWLEGRAGGVGAGRGVENSCDEEKQKKKERQHLRMALGNGDCVRTSERSAQKQRAFYRFQTQQKNQSKT